MISKKYFLAIVLPEPILAKTEAIKQEIFVTYGLKGALRSPSHITLHRPFEWKEQKENLLLEGLRKFKYSPAFPLQLNGFDFFEPRVLFVNVMPEAGLNALHHKLSRYAREQFKLYNETDDLRGFHPHVTVAFRDVKKPVFYELQKEYSLKSFDERFLCQNFSILKLEKTWEVLETFSF